jgi:4'-phosphopantetheinyl transferase EntD
LKSLRQAEFQLGRGLAWRALQTLESNTCPLPPSVETILEKHPDRSPVWPSGFVGSISHSNHWVWAVAGRATEFHSIGIDTEVLVEVRRADQMKATVGTEDEFQKLSRCFMSESVAFTILFSAKEAFFKAWFPITKSFWEFLDVELVDNPQFRRVRQDHPLIEGELMLRCTQASGLTPNQLKRQNQLDPTIPCRVSLQFDATDVFSLCLLGR